MWKVMNVLYYFHYNETFSNLILIVVWETHFYNYNSTDGLENVSFNTHKYGSRNNCTLVMQIVDKS